jgi:hypothetical protein
MWKNILSISFLVFAASHFLDSLSNANAGIGPTTSLATNPLFSAAGYISSGSSSTTVLVSPKPGQEIVVTDITISAQYGEHLEIILQSSSGTEIGRYKSWNYQNYSGSGLIDSHLVSGLRVAENESLQILGYGNGAFTISGYHAHP